MWIQFLCFLFIIDTIDCRLQIEDFPSIKDPLTDAVLSSKADDLTVLADDKLKDRLAFHTFDIVASIAREYHRPTQYTLPNELKLFKGVLTSRSLFIGIYDNVMQNINLNSIEHQIKELTHAKFQAKYLVISVGGNIDWKNFLRRLWNNKLFNVVVLEIQSYDKYKKKVSMFVHQYNKFTGHYNNDTYLKNTIDWFPDKTRNLHGASFGVYNPDKYVDSVLEHTFNVIGVLMNATIENMYDRAENNNFQMVYIAGPVNINRFLDYFSLTVPVAEGKMYLIIPRRKVNIRTDLYTSVILVLVLGLIITAFIVLVMIVMKINRKFRDPLNIICLILGTSVPTEPKVLMEGIFFVSLVIVSGRYTSMLYTELFDLMIDSSEEMDVRCMEDLKPLEVNVTGYWPKGLWLDFPPYLEATYQMADWNKWPIKYDDWENPNKTKERQVLFTKFAHFITQTGARNLILLFNERGSTMVKLANWVPYILHSYHAVKPKCPYKDRIDDILLRIREAGLFEKWNLRKEEKWRKDSTYQRLTEGTTYYHLTTYMLYLYLIPITVFLVELALGYISKRKRSRSDIRIQPRLVATLSSRHSEISMNIEEID